MQIFYWNWKSLSFISYKQLECIPTLLLLASLVTEWLCDKTQVYWCTISYSCTWKIFFTRVGLNECVFSPFISSHTHNKTQFEDAAPFNPTSLHNRNAGTHIIKRLLSSIRVGLLLWCKFRFILTNSKVVSWQREFLLCILHTSHKLSDF